MKIYLKRVNDAVLFEARNERGHTIHIEGSRNIGGEDTGPSPTELLLMSQASCTAIDIVELLKKMRQPVAHIEIEVNGERATNVIPRIFTTIHLHYTIHGDVKPAKAEKAIIMSITKYCTVSKMIEHVTTITHSFKIIAP